MLVSPLQEDEDAATDEDVATYECVVTSEGGFRALRPWEWSMIEEALVSLDAGRRAALLTLVAGRRAGEPVSHEATTADYIASGWMGHGAKDVLDLLPWVK